MLLNLWTVDLIRLVGKFGPNLLQSPSFVHRLVPAFCPRGSMVGTTYATTMETEISTSGLLFGPWDDCLASVTVQDDVIASRVLATDAYFITLISSSGTLAIWSAETCQLFGGLEHNEYVCLMTLNKSQTLLATAGIETYRIWDLSSGKKLYRLLKTAQELTMAISFDSTESGLLIRLDDCSVTCYDLADSQIKWRYVFHDPRSLDQGCPRIMKFSPDNKKVVIAWRGKSLLVVDMIEENVRHYQ